MLSEAESTGSTETRGVVGTTIGSSVRLTGECLNARCGANGFFAEITDELTAGCIAGTAEALEEYFTFKLVGVFCYIKVLFRKKILFKQRTGLSTGLFIFFTYSLNSLGANRLDGVSKNELTNRPISFSVLLGGLLPRIGLDKNGVRSDDGLIPDIPVNRTADLMRRQSIIGTNSNLTYSNLLGPKVGAIGVRTDGEDRNIYAMLVPPQW
jgi:hypothetical protein